MSAPRRSNTTSARLFRSPSITGGIVVAFGVKAHEVCGQESAHFVHEKIAI